MKMEIVHACTCNVYINLCKSCRLLTSVQHNIIPEALTCSFESLAVCDDSDGSTKKKVQNESLMGDLCAFNSNTFWNTRNGIG